MSNKGPPSPDMHRADIVAAITKTGTSCVALSLAHGFSKSAVAHALRNPWPALEAIIATHLRRPPESIWPSRYGEDGKPLSGGWAYPNRRTAAAQRQNKRAA